MNTELTMEQRNLNAQAPMKWFSTCKILSRIFDLVKNVSFNNFLVEGWPGTEDMWKAGDDLMFIDIDLSDEDGKEIYRYHVNTNYTPVPWQSFPMLMEIFKGRAIIDLNEAADGKDSESDKYHRNFEYIGGAMPYALMWSDFGEDDDLDIKCCPNHLWESVMRMDNSILNETVTYALDGNDEVNYYVGTFNTKLNKIQIYDQGDSYEAWIKRIATVSEYKFNPLILQTCEDDDGKCVICYWFTKDTEV